MSLQGLVKGKRSNRVMSSDEDEDEDEDEVEDKDGDEDEDEQYSKTTKQPSGASKRKRKYGDDVAQKMLWQMFPEEAPKYPDHFGKKPTYSKTTVRNYQRARKSNPFRPKEDTPKIEAPHRSISRFKGSEFQQVLPPSNGYVPTSGRLSIGTGGSHRERKPRPKLSISATTITIFSWADNDTVRAAVKVLQYTFPAPTRWDGVDRKKEGVDFEDFEEVGQLALQIDKGRGIKGIYGPAASDSGGYVNTSLAKMIDLLKPYIVDFPVARSNYAVIALWNVLGVAKQKDYQEAIGVYPDGRLNENVRRYIQRFDDDAGLPPAFVALHRSYLQGVKHMASQPSAQITRRRAKVTYNEKIRQRRDEKDKGEGSSQAEGSRYKRVARPSWQQEINDSLATPKFSVPRSEWKRQERFNRAAQHATYAPANSGREIKVTSGFVVSDDKSS